MLQRLLSSPNITTKENVIRRYDHEVKGMSVVKPIMGGPSDAAVIRPAYDSDEGLVISHGICPRYAQDGYVMARLAFDEAVRNAIAVGGKFGYLACLDNFCWPDPVNPRRRPDGEHKLGALVRACIAFYDCATPTTSPIISGKDSMKNDYYSATAKYSILPTLLVTMVGKTTRIHRAMSCEFKKPGDYVYVLGTTHDELGGSEFYRLFDGVGNDPPVSSIRRSTSRSTRRFLSHREGRRQPPRTMSPKAGSPPPSRNRHRLRPRRGAGPVDLCRPAPKRPTPCSSRKARAVSWSAWRRRTWRVRADHGGTAFGKPGACEAISAYANHGGKRAGERTGERDRKRILEGTG